MAIDADKFRSARTAKGWSQERLASEAGVSQTTVDKIERGLTRTTRTIAKFAEVLGVAIGELDPTFGGADTKPSSGFRPAPQIFGERDFPVYAAAEGGPGEMVVSTDPIEIVPRPWYMGEVRDGFAVLIVGDSMEPVFDPGDMAVVNPRLPVMKNKDAIFVQGEERGEFRATIKRVVRWDTKSWFVKQFNEPKEFELSKREWPRALRVVGKLNGG